MNSQPKEKKNGSRTVRMLLRTAKLLNIFLILLPFTLCWFEYYIPLLNDTMKLVSQWAVVGVFAALYIALGRLYEAFRIAYSSRGQLIYNQVLTVVISDGILFMALWALVGRFPYLPPALMVLACQLIFAVLWSCGMHWLHFKLVPPRRTAVLYDMREGLEHLVEEYSLKRAFDIAKTAHVRECLQDLTMLDEFEMVFLSGVHSQDRNVIIKYCVEHNIAVMLIPRVGDVLMSSAYEVHLFHLPIMSVNRYNPTPEYLLMKRMMDVLVSGLLLIIFSPAMAAVALAVRSDGGPVFYRQRRLTKDGRTFELIKFRSMRVDAEKDGVARLASDHDDRITPVGRFIRACRLDELPQLINILAGDMSLVGPRPERPEIAAQYEQELPEFRLRLQVKAGLTGYAQVHGKYNTSPYDKLQMDLMYIAKPSILKDLGILFATVKILFLKESTQGVAQPAAASEKDRQESA